MSKDIASRVQFGGKWNVEQPHVYLCGEIYPYYDVQNLMASILKYKARHK